jgi:hypothetical protein
MPAKIEWDDRCLFEAMPHELDDGTMFASNIARSVAVVLVIKAVIITLAAIFVFGPSQRPRIDLDRHILGETNQRNQGYTR